MREALAAHVDIDFVKHGNGKHGFHTKPEHNHGSTGRGGLPLSRDSTLRDDDLQNQNRARCRQWRGAR